MILIFLIVAFVSITASALPESKCERQAPSNVAKVSGSKALALFNSMDPISAQSGQDSLGRNWFTQNSKSIELSECSVGDCTYTRSRVSRCVKGYNGTADCVEQDESTFYCIDNR